MVEGIKIAWHTYLALPDQEKPHLQEVNRGLLRLAALTALLL